MRLFKREPEYVYVPDPHVAELERVLFLARQQADVEQAKREAAEDALAEALERQASLLRDVRLEAQSQLRVKETRIEYLNQQNTRLAEKLESREQEVQALRSQLAVVESFVTKTLKVPGYALNARQKEIHEREEQARRLYFEEHWSRKRIQTWIWGYTGGTACRIVRRAIERGQSRSAGADTPDFSGDAQPGTLQETGVR